MLRRLYDIAKSVIANKNVDTNRSARTFRFESLEEKALLTKMIDFDLGTGIVTVDGDNTNDVAAIFDNGARVVIDLDGFGERSFPRADVTKIVFNGGIGNDTVQSNSIVPLEAYGNDGDDNLIGGIGNDRLFGGPGMDRLFGNLGDDRLAGGDGDDELIGGEGNDRLFGDRGDDRLTGQIGDDYLSGGANNDILRGDAGDDRIFGNAGDDELYGDLGNDRLYGHGGNDIIRGGFGNDVIFGGANDDMMYGEAGNDRLSGFLGVDVGYGGEGDDFIHLGEGDDTAMGGAGNDRIFGFDGFDTLYGDAGNDRIIGGAGDDDISGGSGDDQLLGTIGNDIIRGDGGKDLIRGDEGNDSLYGGGGRDRIFGGAGMDGMFGGIDDVADRLLGQAGEDRYLYRTGDMMPDRFANSEALVIFSDSDDSWTDIEIETVDNAFRQLHFRTGNTAMLFDTISEKPIVFVKTQSIVGGKTAQNDLYYTNERFFNEETLRFEQRTVANRQISIADWDDTNMALNTERISTTMNMMSKNYDSLTELLRVDDEANQRWANFLLTSNWTDQFPNNPFDYQISQDGLWWYTIDSSFASSTGDFNPSEDWSTIWEHYFAVSRTSSDAEIDSKLSQLDSFFRSRSEL